MIFLKILTTGALAFSLLACGGGGGNAGTNPNAQNPVNSPAPSNTAADVGTSAVSGFVYQLDKNSIDNSGSDKTTLAVTALDANNNPVLGALLSVAVDTGIYTPVKSTTAADGVASGSISIGGNKSNRIIRATLTMNGKSAVVTIPVTGTEIALTSVPGIPTPGAQVTLDVKVTDVSKMGIANTSVVLSGTLGFTQTLTTDTNGNARAQLGAAPTTPGTYSINVFSSGINATRDIQVIAAGGGGIPDAVGPISAPSLAVSPNTIKPNTFGSDANRAVLRAVFTNASNQSIPNVRVRFEITSPLLDTAESISTGAGTVYSDNTGVALASYIPGTRSSGTNGVIIRACYGTTDAAIANGVCPNSVSASLTVASQPLSITLGDNNLLIKGANSLTYIKYFDIAVADSAGNAVANAQISANVDLSYYGKGLYLNPRTWCLNEDINRNGSVDAGEDTDSNGSLSPRKADVILSFVGPNTTGSNGRATIQVEYPQNVATWLVYAVKVTTGVAGSEGTVEKIYLTNFIKGDDENGSFLIPPYGVNNCATAN